MEDYGKIAIIGMAGRFPGANNVEQLWHNLINEVESITFFTKEELSETVDKGLLNDPNYVKAKGILDNVEFFDVEFFNYMPRTAELMDPQHRLFLECAWEAVEDAGYIAEGKNVGVFAGQSMNTYFIQNVHRQVDLSSSIESLQAAIGNDKDSLTTEVAYKLNLKGPAITIQTSSSTSLAAVHIACQSLLNYECNAAIAGGVSIHLPEKSGYLFINGGTMSKDGHCKAFDAKANGFVSGDGVGVVVLKRLEDALSDNDHIYAVIRSSAVNNDGSNKVSYSAPSVNGQADAIIMAHEIANVNPEDIGYIEAHGTGTILGDPIEISALTQSFRRHTKEKNYCAIGSLKTNIGHLDAAAGICGLIKTALALENKTIPASLHFEDPNPQLHIEDSPFYVNVKTKPWDSKNKTRIAGVSSFGMGGTNCHVILEEAPKNMEEKEEAPKEKDFEILTFSAKTESALMNNIANLVRVMEENNDKKIGDIAYTLNAGRKSFGYKTAIVCKDKKEAVGLLKDIPALTFKWNSSIPRNITFMFPGQGSQHVMAAFETYKNEETFKNTIDLCADIAKKYIKEDIKDYMYPKETNTQDINEKIKQTWLAQPILFILEYALANLWISWGVTPNYLIGHSVGDYAAACIAGIFSLEDAINIVIKRGQLIQSLNEGSMAAVFASEDEVRQYLEHDVNIATINGSNQCVISGENDSVEKCLKRIEKDGLVYKKIFTSHAFHSAMMEPILGEFENIISSIKMNKPEIKIINNITGDWLDENDAVTASYWTNHIRKTVNFHKGLTTLLNTEKMVLLEVGPKESLSAIVRRNETFNDNYSCFSSLPHRLDENNDYKHLLTTLTKLWGSCVKINWKNFYATRELYKTSLPGYSFDRKKYWIDRTGQISNANYIDNIKSDDYYFSFSWENRDIHYVNDISEKKNILLISDNNGFKNVLLKAFKKHEDKLTLIQYEDNYLHLLQDGESQVTDLIYLAINKSDALIRGDVHDQCKYEVNAILPLLKELSANGKEINIHIVTNDIFNISGNEVLNPMNAIFIGIKNYFPIENERIHCKLIEINYMQNCNDTAAINLLAENIVLEIKQDYKDDVVALRNNKRWIRKINPIRPPTHIKEKNKESERSNLYLFTGGLGGIALNLISSIAHKEKEAVFVLISRSPWMSSSIQGCVDDISDQRKKNLLHEVEARGNTIHIFKMDVSNINELQTVRNFIISKYGNIKGIIHTAVGFDHCPIHDIDEGVIENGFKAKIAGTWNLYKLFKDDNPDYMLLFSSISSIVPTFGSLIYSMANNFNDAFATYASENGIRTISIGWDTWKEMGMGFETKVIESYENVKKEILDDGLPTISAINAFFNVLKYRYPYLIIASHGKLYKTARKPIEKQKVYERYFLNNEYEAPSSETEIKIGEIWKSILGINKIGVNDNFFEVGGNSLSGVKLINDVEKQFKISLKYTMLYEYPTVKSMAVFIGNSSDKEA